MKTKYAVGLLLTILLTQPVLAQDHSASAVKVPTLTTLDEAVNSVVYFQRGVEEHIAKNDLKQLHAYAFAARDSAIKAHDLATTLPAEKRTELNQHVTRIKSIATQIDKYGDANKPVEAKQFAAKLKEETDAIQKLTGVAVKVGWKPVAAASTE